MFHLHKPLMQQDIKELWRRTFFTRIMDNLNKNFSCIENEIEAVNGLNVEPPRLLPLYIYLRCSFLYVTIDVPT